MVEGGARVLHSFLVGGHADQAVITESPGVIDGMRIFASEQNRSRLLRFTRETTETWGRDSVTWGKLFR